MAKAVAEQGLNAIYSYAGRVGNPRPQPLPTRVGGFGGVEGLARYIRDHGVTHVIDATHPFAAQMSGNAAHACSQTGTPFAALTRPDWVEGDADDWTRVAGIESAVEALNGPAQRVFLAVGRMHLEEFAAQPQHHYLLRLVDQPDGVPMPNAAVEVSRGPFTVAGDIELMRRHGTELIVSKNAGGSGARAKLDAARQLGLPVLMIDRPTVPERTEMATTAQVLDWLAHTGF